MGNLIVSNLKQKLVKQIYWTFFRLFAWW